LFIIDFLKTTIPHQASVLVSQTGDSSFSDELPNEDLTCLSTQPIPSKAWLKALESAFGQAWFDGKRSVVDFQYPVMGSVILERNVRCPRKASCMADS
jgi:hypothetical protein